MDLRLIRVKIAKSPRQQNSNIMNLGNVSGFLLQDRCAVNILPADWPLWTIFASIKPVLSPAPLRHRVKENKILVENFKTTLLLQSKVSAIGVLHVLAEPKAFY